MLSAALSVQLTACTTPQTRALLQDARFESQATSIELGQTPFFPQEEHQCGPAALATALAAASIQIPTDPAGLQVYLPERKGSLQVEMLAAARRQGVVPYLLKPSLTDALIEVASGTPVVVLQNLGLSWYPVWHYAVIIGYNLQQEEILLRSGREKRQVLSLDTFERTWARSSHWAFVVTPPGVLPATATEDAYPTAVAALERLGSVRNAHLAYAAALERWPRSLTAAIGTGNTAYALNDLDLAEAAFRRATQGHPDSAVAFNNLAHVLAKLQRHGEALTSARRAVELGGPHEPEARRTLSEIEAALPH